MLKTRFNELLRKKGEREKRSISLYEVAKNTGISYPTVLTYARNEPQASYKSEVIMKLCDFFNCDVSAFFVVEPETPDQDAGAAAIAGKQKGLATSPAKSFTRRANPKSQRHLTGAT